MLLPTENLTEALGFLGAYDLGAVLVTSRTVYRLAEACLSKFPLRFFKCVTIMPQFGASGLVVYTEDEDGKYEGVAVEEEDAKDRLTAMLRNAVVKQLHVYTGNWQRIEDVHIHEEIFLKIDCMRLNVESTMDPHAVVALLERFRNIKKLYIRSVKGDTAAIAVYSARRGIQVEVSQ